MHRTTVGLLCGVLTAAALAAPTPVPVRRYPFPPRLPYTLRGHTSSVSSIAYGPDGKFLAATFAFDMGFHPADALRQRQTEEVRLLDSQGAPMGVLAASPRDSNHSPSWGR